MCFGGQKQPPPATPAPAPPPPDPVAEETSPTDVRKAEDTQTYGTEGQTLRVDRTAAPPGVRSTGAGLRM